jgi:hypothetical protein
MIFVRRGIPELGKDVIDIQRMSSSMVISPVLRTAFTEEGRSTKSDREGMVGGSRIGTGGGDRLRDISRFCLYSSGQESANMSSVIIFSLSNAEMIFRAHSYCWTCIASISVGIGKG